MEFLEISGRKEDEKRGFWMPRDYSTMSCVGDKNAKGHNEDPHRQQRFFFISGK